MLRTGVLISMSMQTKTNFKLIIPTTKRVMLRSLSTKLTYKKFRTSSQNSVYMKQSFRKLQGIKESFRRKIKLSNKMKSTRLT